MLPFARVIAIAMAAVVCFVLLVPAALRSGNMPLVIGLSTILAVYLVANIVLLKRYPRR